MNIKQKFNEYIASGDPIISISDEQRDWILPFIEREVNEMTTIVADNWRKSLDEAVDEERERCVALSHEWFKQWLDNNHVIQVEKAEQIIRAHFEKEFIRSLTQEDKIK